MIHFWPAFIEGFTTFMLLVETLEPLESMWLSLETVGPLKQPFEVSWTVAWRALACLFPETKFQQTLSMYGGPHILLTWERA